MIFCSTPTPPELSIARHAGAIHLYSFVLSFLYPAVTVHAVNSNIPMIFNIVTVSLKNIAAKIVGIINPHEYMSEHIDTAPSSTAAI